MKRSFAGILAATAIVASFAIAPAANAADVSITGGGSSYDNNMFVACATSVPGVALTYSKSSSGTGRSSFVNKTIDFAGSDWVYGPTDAKPSFDWTYVPVLAGPVVVTYNVSGLNLKLTPAVLSDILQAKITTWNDAKIAKINKGAKLPSNPITIVYRTSGSGTTQNLSAYLRDTVPSAGWVDNSTYTTASGNSKGTGVASNADIVTTVGKTPYSIGYADLADTLTAGLQYAALQNGAGQFVKPSVAASKLFISKQSMANNGVVKFDYEAAIKGAYNLSLVSYGIAPKGLGTPAAAGVKTWLTGYLKTCAPAKAAGLGYVALSGDTLKIALKLAAKVG